MPFPLDPEPDPAVARTLHFQRQKKSILELHGRQVDEGWADQMLKVMVAKSPLWACFLGMVFEQIGDSTSNVGWMELELGPPQYHILH